MRLAAGPGHALTAEPAHALAAGENEERITALNTSLARGDAGLARYLRALPDDEVKLAGQQALIVRQGAS